MYIFIRNNDYDKVTTVITTRPTKLNINNILESRAYSLLAYSIVATDIVRCSSIKRYTVGHCG